MSYRQRRIDAINQVLIDLKLDGDITKICLIKREDIAFRILDLASLGSKESWRSAVRRWAGMVWRQEQNLRHAINQGYMNVMKAVD